MVAFEKVSPKLVKVADENGMFLSYIERFEGTRKNGLHSMRVAWWQTTIAKVEIRGSTLTHVKRKVSALMDAVAKEDEDNRKGMAP